MTIKEYQDAVGRFRPDPCMKSRVAAQIDRRTQRNGRPLRRTLTGVLVAAAVLAITMGAALAASPELRQTVLSFFHLGTAEQVPGPGDMDVGSPDEPGVTQADIGGQVKAQYIQVDSSWYNSYSNNNTELKEDGTVRAFCFWSVEDGVLTKQEEEPQESSFSVTWRGMDYQGAFYWCVRDGEVSLYSNGYAMLSDTGWEMRPVPGRTDAVLLHVSQGSQIEYAAYEFLYHLDTGEVEDILAGTGIEELELAYDYRWTDDLRGLIVTCAHGDQVNSAETYYCDVAAKTLTEVGGLTGTEANYASFADNETLIVSSFTDTACSVWSYDLMTGQKIQTLDQAHLYHEYDEAPYGIMFFGARYGVYAAQTGETSVFDCKTGEQLPVAGFILPKEGNFLSNPSNSKLLYWVYDDSAAGLGVSKLGVLDLEKGTFTSFDREGYDGLYEWAIGWFGDDRVAIHSRAQDGSTLYLYLYEF